MTLNLFNICIYCVLQTVSCYPLSDTDGYLNFYFDMDMGSHVHASLSTLYTIVMKFVDDKMVHVCKECPTADKLIHEIRFIKTQQRYLRNMRDRFNEPDGFVNYNIYIQSNFTDVVMYYGNHACYLAYSIRNNMTNKYGHSTCGITHPYWNETGMDDLFPHINSLWIKWKTILTDMNLTTLSAVTASIQTTVDRDKVVSTLVMASTSAKRINIYLGIRSKIIDLGDYKLWWNYGYVEAVCTWKPYMLCTITSVNQSISYVLHNTDTETIGITMWNWLMHFDVCSNGTGIGYIVDCEKKDGVSRVTFEYQVTPIYMYIVCFVLCSFFTFISFLHSDAAIITFDKSSFV